MYFVISFSSRDYVKKIDTSIFVQKHYLRTKYIEANIEKDIDMNNQLKIRNLHCPVENSDAVGKSHLDGGLNDPSKIKNTAQIDFNDKNLDFVRFVKLNSLPAVREHLTLLFYVDEAISHSVNGSTFLRLDPDEKSKLDEQDSMTLNSTLTTPRTRMGMPNKSYVVSLHEINRNRRDL